MLRCAFPSYNETFHFQTHLRAARIPLGILLNLQQQRRTVECSGRLFQSFQCLHLKNIPPFIRVFPPWLSHPLHPQLPHLAQVVPAVDFGARGFLRLGRSARAPLEIGIWERSGAGGDTNQLCCQSWEMSPCIWETLHTLHKNAAKLRSVL